MTTYIGDGHAPAAARKATGGVGIVDAAYHLPGDPIDIVEWARAQGVPESLVKSLLGNGCRYFHESTEQRSDADLIAAAIERLPPKAAAELPRVDFLIHTHTQAFSMPAPPSSILTEVVGRFGMKPDLSFSCGHTGCASAIAALDWARRLLTMHPAARYALVVTADRVFGGAEYRIRQEAGIQSDSASAILLGRDHLRCALSPATFKNYAKLHEGATSPDSFAALGRTAWLHMKTLLQEHSRSSGLDLRDPIEILPNNSDRHYWTLIAKALDLPDGRVFFDNVHNHGHGCSANLTMNLVDRGLAVVEAGRPVIACAHSNMGAYAALTFVPPRAIDPQRTHSASNGAASASANGASNVRRVGCA